ncbi:nitrile hydratase subunit alpha [Actibacterium mucosum]
MTLKVHDGNADMRCLVLPQQPSWSERGSIEDLQALVTRDYVVGVARDFV